MLWALADERGSVQIPRVHTAGVVQAQYISQIIYALGDGYLGRALFGKTGPRLTAHGQ